jgi:hypothetical protein
MVRYKDSTVERRIRYRSKDRTWTKGTEDGKSEEQGDIMYCRTENEKTKPQADRDKER